LLVIPVDEVELGAHVRAGFTSRRGGVSVAPYAGLNLGGHVGDDPAAVEHNRALLERWVGSSVAFADQVHGRGVVVLDGSPTVAVGQADALVSVDPSVAVGVVVADCVPLLLADDAAGVVAAVHAGRAGLVAGVVQAALEAMLAAGARRDRVAAVLGPCIAGASYEVPVELRAQVDREVPGVATTTSWGTPAIDLAAGVVAVLRDAGVAAVRSSTVDTWTDPDHYSYRREGRTGRFAGVIRPLH
jgi:polyphenol oxidase